MTEEELEQELAIISHIYFACITDLYFNFVRSDHDDTIEDFKAYLHKGVDIAIQELNNKFNDYVEAYWKGKKKKRS